MYLSPYIPTNIVLGRSTLPGRILNTSPQHVIVVWVLTYIFKMNILETQHIWNQFLVMCHTTARSLIRTNKMIRTVLLRQQQRNVRPNRYQMRPTCFHIQKVSHALQNAMRLKLVNLKEHCIFQTPFSMLMQTVDAYCVQNVYTYFSNA